jgi:hypothetical protein
MNAVAAETPGVLVCPNCRAENSPSFTQCSRCTEDLPSAAPVVESVPDSDDLPVTIPVAKLRVESVRPSSRNIPRNEPAAPPAAKLKVIRGRRLHWEFPLYEGVNVIGRGDDRPVDIDVSALESPDKIWSSRRHAIVTLTGGLMTIEDLGSMNGTFVNRRRVLPEQSQPLAVNDVVQVGTIQFKVTV